MNGFPRFGIWISKEAANQVDDLAIEFLETGSSEDLIRLWKAVEPWIMRIAIDVWLRGRYRIGNIVEPEDLVSLAKELFLHRLLRRWDPWRGRFLIYAASSARIEFIKHDWRLMRRKETSYGLTPENRPESDSGQVPVDVRLVLEDSFRRAVVRAKVDWKSPECLVISLRELARNGGGVKGNSKSTLHKKRKEVIEMIRRDLGDDSGYSVERNAASDYPVFWPRKGI